MKAVTNQLSMLVLMLVGIVMVSCTDTPDYYDPNYRNDLYKANWEKQFGAIDPNQDWTLADRITANVTIYTEEPGDYTLKAYSSNPILNKKAVLMGIKTISASSGKNSVNFEFDAPKTIAAVYILKESKEGYYTVVPATVSEKKITAEFGVASLTKAATRAGGALTTWTETVPEGTFPTVVPSDAIEVGKELNIPGDGGNYVFRNGVNPTKMNIWNGDTNGTSIYFEGTNTITGSWYTGGNTTFYIMPGAEVIFDLEISFAKNLTFVIGEGAKVTFRQNVQFNDDTTYNKGTITLPVWNTSGNTLTYNMGTMNVTNDIAMRNAGCIIVNSGVITGNSLTLEGTSRLYNEDTGTITITGNTTVNSNSAVWSNMGFYSTGSMQITATSENWKSGCKTLVLGDLTLNFADGSKNLVIDGESYIECKNLYMDNAGIDLYDKSLFQVRETATFGTNRYTRNNGFISYATAGKEAVVKIGTAVQKVAAQGGSVSYKGNMFVACTNHFAQGKSGDEDLYHVVDGAQMAPSASAPINIDEMQCSGGYTPTPPTPPSDESQSWIIAYEDLGDADDYDFNDIVLKVTYVSGETTATVQPLAGGGTLASYISFNEPSGRKELGEIHALFGVPMNEQGSEYAGYYPMINTASKTNGVNGKTASSQTINVPATFSLAYNADPNAAGFTLRVKKHNEHSADAIIASPTAGEAPQMFVAPGDWKWPIERVPVCVAYPDFKNWSANHEYSNWFVNCAGEQYIYGGAPTVNPEGTGAEEDNQEEQQPAIPEGSAGTVSYTAAQLASMGYAIPGSSFTSTSKIEIIFTLGEASYYQFLVPVNPEWNQYNYMGNYSNGDTWTIDNYDTIAKMQQYGVNIDQNGSHTNITSVTIKNY